MRNHAEGKQYCVRPWRRLFCCQGTSEGCRPQCRRVALSVQYTLSCCPPSFPLLHTVQKERERKTVIHLLANMIFLPFTFSPLLVTLLKLLWVMKARTYTAALLQNIIQPIKDWITFLSEKGQWSSNYPKVHNYIRKLCLNQTAFEVLLLCCSWIYIYGYLKLYTGSPVSDDQF